MIKTNRFISLLLAVAVLIPLLAGCTGSSADYCVKVEGDTVSIPSMNLSFSFPAPWFVITDEEAEAIAQDVELLRDYVDEEGNLLCSQPEAYTTEKHWRPAVFPSRKTETNTAWKISLSACSIKCRMK